MKKAMDLEINLTLESSKNEEYCDEYWSLTEDQRQRVGLTISYYMGWNKSSIDMTR